jgi:hypothetical protein
MRMNIQQYEVGKFYRVPIIAIGRPLPRPDGSTLTLDNWEGFRGDLPLLHPYTEDEDFDHPDLIGSNSEKLLHHHGHPDWRFMTDFWFEHFLRTKGLPLMKLTTIMLPWAEYVRYIPHEFRHMKCYRVYGQVPEYERCGHTAALEKKYRCAALQNGKCPHRGTLQKAMIAMSDGTLVCPAHGLRWARDSGALVPRMPA